MYLYSDENAQVLSQNFEVSSFAVAATDPSYKRFRRLAHVFENAANGIWNVRFQKEEYIEKIGAYHELFRSEDIYSTEEALCGVDSGLFGFFDEGNYLRRKSYTDDEVFKECRKAASPVGAVSFGCVCVPGLGDGAYKVTGLRNKEGVLIGLEAVFLEGD